MLGAVGGIEEGDVVQGGRAVFEAMKVDSETWAERRYEVQRLVATDHGVLVLAREHRRGRGSEVAVHADMGFLYEFRGERIARIRPFIDQAAALDAAGLPE
jgi:ketosteroid isomerase-like protein